MAYRENKEIDQDRVTDTVDHFNRYGTVLFPENRRMYEGISDRLKHADTVLEAGCGNGVGFNILLTRAFTNGKMIMAACASDKLERNVKFAHELYPYYTFATWDLNTGPFSRQFDVVVCIEAIEHVKNYRAAIKNLIDSAKKEVWITTPNRRRSDEEKPSNPYHVREFYPEEMLEMIGAKRVEILNEKFEVVEASTKESPLVYHIVK